jgi:hypothetical protein
MSDRVKCPMCPRLGVEGTRCVNGSYVCGECNKVLTEHEESQKQESCGYDIQKPVQKFVAYGRPGMVSMGPATLKSLCGGEFEYMHVPEDVMDWKVCPHCGKPWVRGKIGYEEQH